MHVTAEWGGMRGRQPSRRGRERAGIIIVVIIIIDTPLDMVGSGKRRDERGREGVTGVESVSPTNGSTRPQFTGCPTVTATTLIGNIFCKY